MQTTKSKFFTYQKGNRRIPYNKGEFKGIFPRRPEQESWYKDENIEDAAEWYESLEYYFGKDWKTKSELILYMSCYGVFDEFSDVEELKTGKRPAFPFTQENLDKFQKYSNKLNDDGGVTLFLMNCTKEDNIESRLKIVHLQFGTEIKINKIVYYNEDNLLRKDSRY